LPLPTQAIFPGLLESTYRRELQNLFSKNVLARLWAKDTSLWPAEDYQAESMESNLSWLDLPEQLGPLLARVVARAAKVEPAGFEDVVFVTMGVSSLAAESILRSPAASLGKRTFLLDTIDPDSVRAFDGMLDFGTTLFVFANKSGKPIETHSLPLYFLERLKMMGIHSPAHHFITLTEENSYLGQLAGEYDFLDSFLDPPGIHGHYSSLIHFNFFLAALCRLDPGDLLARTQSMRDACGPSAPGEANPAASLGAFLAAAEIEGLDRLVFFSTDSLKSVARRIGYQVGASTGKRIVPDFRATVVQARDAPAGLLRRHSQDGWRRSPGTHQEARRVARSWCADGHYRIEQPRGISGRAIQNGRLRPRWLVRSSRSIPSTIQTSGKAGRGPCRYWSRSRPSVNLLHPPRAFEKAKSSYMPKTKHASRSRH